MSQRSMDFEEPHRPLVGARGLRNPPESWRVLVVESDTGDAETLIRGLRRHGHLVDRAETGGAALDGYGNADLVLLDLELPDLDGLEVCREIRSVCDVPVIAVTARGSELDRVLGLQAGADDYLVKPYGFRELVARINAVMRRSRPRPPAPKVLAHGPLLIDAGAREVRLDGRPVCVTRKEFDLLYLLASHPETVIPRKRLMQQIWGDSWSRRTVDSHVSSLRNKLGASDWIITVRGVGFRLGHG
ncbi:response regulator transcription factor [Streptomyces sp. SP18CS02]|uniref:response regulator transcription factor n=1 Tax=Streptomyces sp. SP18CS02 TaxID=3002531 RepID=UPI002E75B833|nr:response regulator transcription factor [Streptomyces sp. SP18CS02]MEE1756580.1 response regulator transcription factor [Streptomyces sp. SP18CS02]